MTYQGIVKNGVVVLEGEVKLPEGLTVEVIVPELTPELQGELEAWELASDEALAVVEEAARKARDE